MMRKIEIAVFVLALVQQGWCGYFDFTEFDDPYYQNFFFNKPAVIIRQHHGRCTTTLDGNNEEGVCLTRPECAFSGGRSQGRQSCLLGTCCVYSRGCNRITSNRVSYFEGTSNNNQNINDCTYRVRVENSNICQMRLDFDSLDFPAPSREQFLDPAGSGTVIQSGPYNCRNAVFRVDSPNNNGRIPNLCGDNSGQHIYVPVNASRGERELVLKVINNYLNDGNGNTANNVNSISWKIKITQLECPNFSKHQKSIRTWEDSHLIAPPGCLQYYTNPSGTIRNLGYESGATSVTNANHYESNLNYAICFRRTADMCGIDFNVNAFSVGSTDANAPPGPGTTTDTDCTTTDTTTGIIRDLDFLYVPNGLLTTIDNGAGGPTTGTAVVTYRDRYCGTFTVNSRIRSVTPGPFYIFFKTDNIVVDGTTAPDPTVPDTENGWDLNYATIYGNNCGSF